MRPDWRERMVAAIIGDDAIDGSGVVGGAHALRTYRDQYRWRLIDAVAEDVPGLMHLLDDPRAVFEAYVLARPQRTWTLDRCTDALADWLEEEGHPVAVVEMARLDHAVTTGLTAPDGPLPDGLDLAISPHVHLLTLTTNVHDIRGALIEGEPVPALADADVLLVVYRHADLFMRTWEPEPGLWWVLHGLARGLPVSDVLADVGARGLLHPADAAATVQDWFTQLAQHGLVCGR